MSPYLWSIVKFSPQIEAISAMPLVIKTHIVGAFVILGMISFTRLVILDAALEESKNLIELLRLLVFRKDNVVYSLAHRLISAAEFYEMQSPAVVARKSS